MDDADTEGDGAGVVLGGFGVVDAGVALDTGAALGGDLSADAFVTSDDQRGSGGWEGLAVSEEQAAHDVEREDDEGEADEALRPGVQPMRQGELKQDDDGSEQGDHGGVPGGVEKAEAHGGGGLLLDAGDVGDGRDVIVVEAVPEAENGAGEQRDFERRVHHDGSTESAG